MVVDLSGNVIVADTDNHRIQVFNSNGVFLRKWGSQGSGDGQFIWPGGVAVDASGNVIVADSGNNRIQVFDSSGVFLRKCGSQGSEDGQFNSPSGVTVDASGNVIVSDSGNRRIQVLNSNGNFIMKFGAIGSDNGQFSGPWGVAIDVSNNLYVADTYNHRIQKFVNAGGPPGAATLLSPGGTVSTSTPAYTWNAVAAASWYRLWVHDASASPKIDQWFTAEECGCAAGTGTCSVSSVDVTLSRFRSMVGSDLE